jgi:hypothetical protein
MCGLQDVPGDGGGVHAAAQHRNHVGQEHKTKSPLLQDGAHYFNCKAMLVQSFPQAGEIVNQRGTESR